MKVTQLLLSLLPTSLVVLASAEAAPVQLNVLNPDNFKDTIAKGVWYVALRYFNSKVFITVQVHRVFLAILSPLSRLCTNVDAAR
jgi:hypothetical protein